MRTKSEIYLKGDEICLEAELKNISENKSLSPFPMFMLKCLLSKRMLTKLNRSIRRWGHVSCQLGPSLSGVTFSDQKGNWFLAPHERQRPAHNRALKFTKNTWLPPLCSHLLASPCQSGSQPQPKEMSSRIDKEPRTRISKYLLFVTCQSTFMIGTLKSEAILMSPLPLVGFDSQYSVFMINL